MRAFFAVVFFVGLLLIAGAFGFEIYNSHLSVSGKAFQFGILFSVSGIIGFLLLKD